MTLKQHQRIRTYALAATAAIIATMLPLAFGTKVGLAADYQDAQHNVCEGNRVLTEGCPKWGEHVTGESNVALGDSMMPNLTSGSHNVALDKGALETNISGSDNIASGFRALDSNTEGNDNIANGSDALRSNKTGSDNVASGADALFYNAEGHGNLASGRYALFHNTSGSDNVASGAEALFLNKEGSDNIASGRAALSHNEGSDNIASGFDALLSNTTGNFNIASGLDALFNNTGSSNVALGGDAGKNLTTGSNNIDIANEGVAAEEGTTRIGTEGTQMRAFVAGVYKKPVTTPACAVKVNAEGQLGCNSGENSTAIATFASRKEVPSGNCLAYTDIGPAGTGVCPGKTSGFSSSALLAGPTPAGGATVTNLYADSNAAVTGTDTVLVAVIDNTSGATLLSCTVTGESKNKCSNASESGSATAGDNIEVKLTATGVSGNKKLWRVTFRF